MKSKAPRQRFAKGSIELLEEALHLLRMAPLPTIVSYYIGTVPFALGILFFWADMSRSAFAEKRCAAGAMMVAALFVWMKAWQSVFASQLRRTLTDDAIARPWSIRRLLRTAQLQGILHGIGLFVLPAALVIALPFGWVFAFFQNATYFGEIEGGGLRTLYQRAAAQAKLWQGQNHILLTVLSLFGFFVFLNAVIAIIQVPGLIKTLLGIETAFTKAGWWSISNTTFLATAVMLTYLAIDPLIKAVYVLRCFYGESLTSGEDLRVELRAQKTITKTGAWSTTAARISILILTIFLAVNGSAVEAPTSGDKTTLQSKVSPEALDRSITEVLSKREFTWRLPREKTQAVTEQSKKGWFELFVDGILETISNAARTVRDWFRAVIEWLEKRLGNKHESEDHTKSSSSGGWIVTLQVFVFVLFAAVASAVAILLFRVWRQRRQTRDVTIAQAVAPKPDLTDENVTANELPENEWMKLARELMEQGQLRMALRALYLASLAHLAEREMITVAKFKSNRDYEMELSRRARPRVDLQNAFRENVGIFERVWYGMHEVTTDALSDFQQNCERIRTC